MTLRVESGIATLTLNRPEKRNAIDEQIADEICHALDDISDNDEINILIVTGAGKTFCAGGDLSVPVFDFEDEASRFEFIRNIQRFIAKLRSLEIPVIGSINGAAIGAGCDLALACDVRIVSEKASFSEVFTRMGLVPDCGGSYFLPRLIGVSKACEMILTGDSIDAHEAERIGLVNRVVPHEGLHEATMEFASKLTAIPQFSLRKAKLAIYRGLSLDLETQLKHEAKDQALCVGNPETRAIRSKWLKGMER